MYPPPAIVMENRDLGSGVFLLRLLNEEIAQAALLKPGCFVMLQTGSAVSEGVPDPMLSRPMSIQKSDGRVFDVLYRIVGLGTGCLSRLEKGDQINVLGPLGNSFSLPEKENGFGGRDADSERWSGREMGGLAWGFQSG
jgi:dihydroorotate dehydrogenase electron transfer subunit